MTPPLPVLEIDWLAPPPLISKACASKPLDPNADACTVTVPLKEADSEEEARYIRFDRLGDRFVLSEKNRPENLTWMTSFPGLPPIDHYVRTLLEQDLLRNKSENSPPKPEEPRSSLWQFQAAVLVGGALERETPAPDLAGTFAAGIGVGARYFSPKYLGPVGFGIGSQYWWVGKEKAEDGDNLTFFPSIGVRPTHPEMPFDVSAGPLLGFTEPLPSSGELKFTSGAALQVNFGLPIHPLKWGSPFSADIFNLTLSFLARPGEEENGFGGTILLGINPLGLANALSVFFMPI